MVKNRQRFCAPFRSLERLVFVHGGGEFVPPGLRTPEQREDAQAMWTFVITHKIANGRLACCPALPAADLYEIPEAVFVLVRSKVLLAAKES